MIKNNVFSAAKEWVVAHEGEGQIEFVRAFESKDFNTGLSFIDYVEIPPGSSIGIHRHGDNEEVYFIVEGSGIMTTNDEQYRVHGGDLIVNYRGWSHGLKNNMDMPLKVLVWEVSYYP